MEEIIVKVGKGVVSSFILPAVDYLADTVFFASVSLSDSDIFLLSLNKVLYLVF